MQTADFALDDVGGDGYLRNVSGQTAEEFAGMHRVAMKGYAGAELPANVQGLIALQNLSRATLHRILHDAFSHAKECVLPLDDTGFNIHTAGNS
jgi:hypothetical protein